MFFHIIILIASFLSFIIPLLISVAFFTILERQVIGSIQRRQGPNIVGFFGLLQPISDGVKLLLKEIITPKSSNFVIFILSPSFTFVLAIMAWVVLPLWGGWIAPEFELGLLYLIAISSVSVHSIIMAGWSSNSKYSFLGALRSAAQMISYEISMGICILSVITLTGSLNLEDIEICQEKGWFFIPLFPMFIIFFICSLAETNRHPFDLPEAEAELVSGYNVEYSSIIFALFFLAEYSSMIAMCTLNVLLFFGGGISPFNFNIFFDFINDDLSSEFWWTVKILFFMILFIVIRVAFPRYRYDQLMKLGWKVLMPLSFSLLILEICILISFDKFYFF